MEMGGGDQYGTPDLRQLMAGRTHFPVIPQAQDPYFIHRIVTPQPQYFYEPMVAAGEVLGQAYSSNCGSTPTATGAADNYISAAAGLGGVEIEGGSCRWPRQETLTLLEIRSCLDYKFKEANHKGPLWDEVARIMMEEHGYMRSGKKCREKFENLYKYYKKTKEGKAGRHGGKHYRFFRQLEAIYGETSSNNNQTNSFQETPLLHTTQKISESFSTFSNSSEFETSSTSEKNDHDHNHDLSAITFMMNSNQKQKRVNSDKNLNQDFESRVRKTWKSKVMGFVELQMKKLEETQEAWMEKMMKNIEHREQERIFRDEEWRRQEVARFDQEHEFWARERAAIEARASALMEALKKCKSPMIEESTHQNLCQNHENYRWSELEISSLIQLRSSLEQRFRESGNPEGIWEEIGANMVCLGYDRSGNECKEKWENMNIYFTFQ